MKSKIKNLKELVNEAQKTYQQALKDFHASKVSWAEVECARILHQQAEVNLTNAY